MKRVFILAIFYSIITVHANESVVNIPLQKAESDLLSNKIALNYSVLVDNIDLNIQDGLRDDIIMLVVDSIRVASQEVGYAPVRKIKLYASRAGVGKIEISLVDNTLRVVIPEKIKSLHQYLRVPNEDLGAARKTMVEMLTAHYYLEKASKSALSGVKQIDP